MIKKALSILTVLAMCLIMLPTAVLAADCEDCVDEAAPAILEMIQVGGMELHSGEYLSNGGIISDTVPEGGYANYENGVLTLKGYRYEGPGMKKTGIYEDEDLPYTECVLINADGALTVRVEEESVLTNTAEVGEDTYSVGIYADLLTITGGPLTIKASTEAIYGDSVFVENAVLTATGDIGIYAEETVTITDSTVTLSADTYGIYTYNGGVTIDCTEVTVPDDTQRVPGAAVTIHGDIHAILSAGKVKINELLRITAPEGGTLSQCSDTHDGDGDGIEESVVYYESIVNSDGVPAADVVIELSGCTDLDPGAWYYDAVDYVLKNELMSGVGGGLFAPGARMNRAMIVTILWNLEGKPTVDHDMSFADIPADSWYAQAVRWAASEGIVSGYSTDRFAPDDSLTREQIAAILYSYTKYKGSGFIGAWMFRLDFPDIADISEWAYEPLCWMTMKEIMSGKDGGILDPKGFASRAETAQILMRFLES